LPRKRKREKEGVKTAEKRGGIDIPLGREKIQGRWGVIARPRECPKQVCPIGKLER